MNHQNPWNIYAKRLLPLGQGYAVHRPDQPKTNGGVQVGDVGFISEGQFHPFFNVMNQDSPINDSLPENLNLEFLSINPKLRQQEDYLMPPNIYTSEKLEVSSVEGGGGVGEYVLLPVII